MGQVIIINGNAGVGKDTLINFARRRFKIKNISSIDPIKRIARMGGWRDKDEKGRKLLVDLKELFVKFNDLPTKFLMEEFHKFQQSDKHFMFVHIREPQEIEKFKSLTNAKTLLVTRNSVPKMDCICMRNNVEYNYDFEFANDGESVKKSGQRFVELLQSIS